MMAGLVKFILSTASIPYSKITMEPKFSESLMLMTPNPKKLSAMSKTVKYELVLANLPPLTLPRRPN